jgi:hypothetical protein
MLLENYERRAAKRKMSRREMDETPRRRRLFVFSYQRSFVADNSGGYLLRLVISFIIYHSTFIKRQLINGK